MTLDYNHFCTQAWKIMQSWAIAAFHWWFQNSPTALFQKKFEILMILCIFILDCGLSANFLDFYLNGNTRRERMGFLLLRI